MEPYVVLLDRTGDGLVLLIAVKELKEFRARKPRIHTWRWGAITGRIAFAAAASKDKSCLYIAGGEDASSGDCLATVSRYNLHPILRGHPVLLAAIGISLRIMFGMN
jgi:hypothetical protein